MTGCCEAGSFLTSAPITPRDVNLRYSKGRDLEVVLRKGYKNNGMCAIHVSPVDSQLEVHTIQE